MVQYFDNNNTIKELQSEQSDDEYENDNSADGNYLVSGVSEVQEATSTSSPALEFA